MHHRLAVIGNPIMHSMSPVVFDIFAKECNINLEYTKIFAENDQDFQNKVTEFFNSGGLAMNVTSPFKQIAYNFIPLHTVRASFCKAGNFIIKDNNSSDSDIKSKVKINNEQISLRVDTTDGIGLIRDIEINNNISIFNKSILIIGSGFVLESILLDFIVKNPQRIDILARNELRIKALQDKFAVDIYSPLNNYDIIINSVPKGEDNLLLLQINNVYDGILCYDLNYAYEMTPFLNYMQFLNKNIVLKNGFGMLVEQAREAFYQLFGIIPDTIQALKLVTKYGVL